MESRKEKLQKKYILCTQNGFPGENLTIAKLVIVFLFGMFFFKTSVLGQDRWIGKQRLDSR